MSEAGLETPHGAQSFGATSGSAQEAELQRAAEEEAWISEASGAATVMHDASRAATRPAADA
eukprot:11844199-Karenia_brevis.AAC.1